MSSRWLGPAIRSCTCSPCTMIFHGAPPAGARLAAVGRGSRSAEGGRTCGPRSGRRRAGPRAYVLNTPTSGREDGIVQSTA